MAQGDAYDEQMHELLGHTQDTNEIFWELAMQDIREACDLFRPVWEGGSGRTATCRSRSTRTSRTTP